MGRPIGGDVGDDDFGRPIDLDEGLGETSMQEEHTSMQDPGPSRGGGHPVSDINAQRGSGVGMLSKLLPQQNQYPNQSRAPAQRALNTTNNHAQPSRIQDQNRHPQSSSGSVTKRPVAPSMGGFHFPPGMNPLQQQQSRLPPQALGQRSGSGIGLKRPSDAMSGPTTTAGAKRPGMGLDTHTGPDTNTVKREVFARLDGEGGEIKRVRR
ncbi:hypothetical protein BDZ94DRAFT_1066214 [Collybia nuda]|uniref:Uncharacterized protein n=1 Tax=Collybia nuda TaxID=64659 RepID=A0A9P6CFG2_9AGAR|nr:hypothetical protein BDZ94DRAFT_1066214 [Collybia nuda]